MWWRRRSPPPVIQTMWVGPTLSRIERLALASFAAHGHPVHLYAYDLPAAEAPPGVTVLDAREVLPAEGIFAYGPAAGAGAGSLAAFSNVFRYKLLLDKGGWWADTDVVCLRPFPAGDRPVISQERAADGTPTSASCVLRLPQGSEVARYLYEEAAGADKARLRYSDIGPRLVHKAVARFRLRRYAARPDAFCPIDWFAAERLVTPGVAVPRRAYAVHLWNEMWRRAGMDKNAPPPAGSVVHGLLHRYGFAA